MPNLNKVFLMGHLVRDADIRYTPSGMAICKFVLAVNRSYQSGGEWKKEVCFIDITVWGKPGEKCADLGKGDAIHVEGYLRLEQWESQGQKRSKISVTAERIHILGGKPEPKEREIPGDDEDSIPF